MNLINTTRSSLPYHQEININLSINKQKLLKIPRKWFTLQILIIT